MLSRNIADGPNVIVQWFGFLSLFLKIPVLSPASAAGYSTGSLRISSDYKTCDRFTLNYGVFVSLHILSIFFERHSSTLFPFHHLQPFNHSMFNNISSCESVL